MIELLPGLVRHEYPRGETPKHANSFISQFMAAKGEFPPSEFWAMGMGALIAKDMVDQDGKLCR